MPLFSQLTLADAETSVLAILDRISDQLAHGGRVEIRGFGSFKVNVRPARRGRNPKTGERVDVPAKPAPAFKAGIELRALVDKD